MKAVACQDAELELVDRPAPGPARARSSSTSWPAAAADPNCHARQHADAQADVLAEAGYDGFMRSGQ